MASSAMGLKLGVFGFLPMTHAKSNAIKKGPQSSSAMRHLTCVYLHAQSTVNAGDICTWQTTVFLITEKKNPKIRSLSLTLA